MNSLNEGIFKSLRSELTHLSDVISKVGSPSSPGSPQTRFESIYEQSRLIESQDDRRRRLLLKYRNTKRDDTLLKKYAATFAEICQTEQQESPLAFDPEEDVGNLSLEPTATGANSATKHSSPRRPKNKFPRLMLSEWLLDVPSDFEDSWIMMPCPNGKRCSVVTSKGETFVYSRTGQHLLTGSTDLPGGSSTKRQGTNFTVLDCVFDFGRRIFHVLDVLFWNGSSLVDNTVEFRLFWLKSRLEEIESRIFTAENDQYELVSLPQCCCASEELEYFFASTTSISSIDGYLFYHKDGLYISDTTPLVCWLKPFMIPEILRIPVGGDFVKGKPSGYSTLAEYVKMLEEKHPKKPRRKFRDHSEETMETEENSDDPVLC